MWILRLAAALDEAKVPYAVVGGYAVALHGAVRGTVDIDVVIPWAEETFNVTEATLRSLGLEPRLPVTASEVFRFREEWMRNRNMAAWTFVNPSRPSEMVDVVLTHDLNGMKTTLVEVKGQPIRIVAVDDLIAMKRDCGRAQDLEDVRALERIR